MIWSELVGKHPVVSDIENCSTAMAKLSEWHLHINTRNASDFTISKICTWSFWEGFGRQEDGYLIMLLSWIALSVFIIHLSLNVLYHDIPLSVYPCVNCVCNNSKLFLRIISFSDISYIATYLRPLLKTSAVAHEICVHWPINQFTHFTIIVTIFHNRAFVFGTVWTPNIPNNLSGGFWR